MTKIKYEVEYGFMDNKIGNVVLSSQRKLVEAKTKTTVIAALKKSTHTADIEIASINAGK